MRDSSWLIRYAISVALAALVALGSISFSGYESGGLLGVLVKVLLLTVAITYIAIFFRMVTSAHINPSQPIAFDATERISLTELMLHRLYSSEDSEKGIRFYPLAHISNFLNPLSTMAIIFLFFTCILYFTVGTITLSLFNFIFLLAQSIIVYSFSLVVLLIAFQTSSIYRLLIIQTGLIPAEGSIMRTFSFASMFKSKPVGLALAHKASDKPANVEQMLAPATKVLSRDIAKRFTDIYLDANNIDTEISNITLDFNIPASTFSEQMGVVNEIVNVFIPLTVANCDKTFKNTILTKELKEAFQANVQRGIVYKIRGYEEKIKVINAHLLATRLTPFDTTGVSTYIEQAHLLHLKIGNASGAMANKQLVISQSVINELLPSLMSTWSMTTAPEQRDDIQQQFKDVIAFLEKQLASLVSNPAIAKGAPAKQALLTLDAGRKVDMSDLGMKIGQNKQYIEILNKEWD